jgi:integral membrane protein
LARTLLDFSSLDGALLRYRVLAYIVGVGLATLVFVGIPLQIAGHAELVEVAGPVHGFFYIAYLLFALDLARRARFSIVEMLAMVGAGLVPILAFVIERRITHRVKTGDLSAWTLPGALRRQAAPDDAARRPRRDTTK